jgi:hypothetical protein
MPMGSRKRKRGKYQNRLMEEDDDAIDIVTFEEVKIDTPGGQFTKRIQVPLRPEVKLGQSTDRPLGSTSNAQHETFEDVEMGMNTPDDEQQTSGPQGTKVRKLYS